MRVGWFTAVHVKTAEAQELRLLLTNRKTLLTSRVTLAAQGNPLSRYWEIVIVWQGAFIGICVKRK
jgi:hypothetical protein